MVRIVVEIPASEGWVFCMANATSPLMNTISRREMTLSGCTSIVNWMEVISLLTWLRKFCNCSEP
jgi:hypothetical protein